MSVRALTIDLGDENDHYPPQIAPDDVEPLRRWLGKNMTIVCSLGGHRGCLGICALGSQVVEERPCLCPCHLPYRTTADSR